MKAIIYYLLMATLALNSQSVASAEPQTIDEKIEKFKTYVKHFRQQNLIPVLALDDKCFLI